LARVAGGIQEFLVEVDQGFAPVEGLESCAVSLVSEVSAFAQIVDH
jgi:hypothetical protein